MNVFLPIQRNDKYNSSLSSVNDRLERECKEFFERRRLQKIEAKKKNDKGLTFH